MSTAISTVNLTKLFPRTSGYRDLLPFNKRQWTQAVKDVNLEIKEGEFFGLLGPNGAGKTTLIKMLCCLVLSNSGTARVFGHDIHKEEQAVKQPRREVSSGVLPVGKTSNFMLPCIIFHVDRSSHV
jgi:ABC-type multidrug transport system ATPase subunit